MHVIYTVTGPHILDIKNVEMQVSPKMFSNKVHKRQLLLLLLL